MFPWLWFWSPVFHLPFSGSVAQQIEPDTNWFFAGIPSSAGNGLLEKKAFDVASYGRQLGWITEVLLAAKGSDAIAPGDAEDSLRKLEAAYLKIEAVKEESRAELVDVASAALQKLGEADPAALEMLILSAQARLKAMAPRLGHDNSAL
ncbi:hypothetical protein [Variovorax sp. YR216]|uniref:hypothetical protein n=1 Tax=Variovorax sp. YR216 TaxID=1882828 RepID=UPI00089A6AE3|nr:hypothetical protein [Variovorax sp. YR216]SEA06011.1 hypothetical protein SAMN05444680_101372 [Variovorax sp. YR216]